MQLRVARPTRDIETASRFYLHVLGLERLAGFADHDGIDGVMLGKPGADWHLELTCDRTPRNEPQRSDEDLLVLYFPVDEFDRIKERVESAGLRAVTSRNPYWERNGALQVEDPDGSRIVLFPGEWPA